MKQVRNVMVLTLCLLMVSTTSNIQANALLEDGILGGAYLTFAGKHGGELSKTQLRKYSSIKVEGCAKGSKFTQFTLHIYKNGKHTSYRCAGGNLTATMVKALRSLEPGDSFVFKNVKAQLPNKEGIVDVWAKKFTVV